MSTIKIHQAHRLSVYHPEDEVTDDGPVILRFPKARRRPASATAKTESLVERIRTIRKNRFCPACGKAHIQPVSANTALYSRDAMPVPGTGQLIGFECQQCGHHWQA